MFDFIRANLRLLLGLIAAVIGLLAVQFHVTSGTNEFLGVADSKEFAISFETPVTVKRVFVLPGERVKKGQPIVEVIPTEINLRILELKSELGVLESEKNVRSALLGSLGSGSQIDFGSPIVREIAGIKEQIKELQRQQSHGVRFAEADGIVATVAYRPLEQVAPFIPIVTLISESPDMIFGFLHENRASSYRIGDNVEVIPLADSTRSTQGQIVSMGSRITPFPVRFQQFVGDYPQHYGREVMIRISPQNRILAGERVQVVGAPNLLSEGLNFISIADAHNSDPKVDSEKILAGLDLEASGLVYDQSSDTLIVVSDDAKKNQSPFRRLAPETDATPLNLKLVGIGGIEDLESVTQSENGQLYAMSSLTAAKGKSAKSKSSLLVRFKLTQDSVIVDRSIDLRSPLLSYLKGEGLVQRIKGSLDDPEVESLAFGQGHAYIGLKEPQLEDGSSVILKIHGFEKAIEEGHLQNLNFSIHSVVRLDDSMCNKASRITDLVKAPTGLLILGNCDKDERRGQVWQISDAFPMESPELLFRLPESRPEGLLMMDDGLNFYISSDNGKKEGSDIFHVQRFTK